MGDAITTSTATGISAGSAICVGVGAQPRNSQRQTSIVAIVAIQRSGTHLLREILNSNSNVAVSPEPFNRLTQTFCWHRYIQNQPADKEPLASQDDVTAMLDGFTEAMEKDVRESSRVYGGPKGNKLVIGLDVKYNQLKSVNALYSDLRFRPFLLDYFSLRRVKVIHLVRRNIVHTAISAIVANMRQIWQSYDRTLIEGRYRVPTDQFFHYVDWINAEREIFEKLASDLNVHTCYYEDLVADLKRVRFFGRFPENTLALNKLAAFLDVPNRFRNKGKIRKVINRPYKEVIENYDELLAAIKDSPLWEFAATI